MARRNSTVKIVDSKVVFSQEIIDYFENLRTVENSEWIDKYFEVLSDSSNFDAKKFNLHHIKPCFAFKDENHKSRKETEKLGNQFNENIIKLSIYNHLLCHYYLWKIFNNEDSRRSVYLQFNKINVDNFTEDKIKELAKIKEEYSKENMTEEERKELTKIWKRNHKDNKKQHDEKYRKTHKDKIAKYKKDYYQENKETLSKQRKIRYENNKELESKQQKTYYENNKEDIKRYKKEWRQENKERISENNKAWYQENKDRILDDRKKYSHQECIDPTDGTTCTLCALQGRIKRHPDLYPNVIATECIINRSKLTA